MCGKPCYGSYTVTPSGVPKYESSSQRPKTTQTRQLATEEGNLSGPIHTGHTSTLTPTTLANPSHNSRVPHVHLPSRTTTQEMLFRATTQGISRALTPILSNNSRNPTTSPSKHHEKPCRSHIHVQQTNIAAIKLPGGGHVPLGAASFQTAWRGMRTARRQAPQNHQQLKTPPGGTVHTAKRIHAKTPLILPQPPGVTTFTTRWNSHQTSWTMLLSSGGLKATAWRCISTNTVLVSLLTCIDLVPQPDIQTHTTLTKTIIVLSSHTDPLSLRWHLAASPVPPGGACDSGQFPRIFAPARNPSHLSNVFLCIS